MINKQLKQQRTLHAPLWNKTPYIHKTITNTRNQIPHNTHLNLSNKWFETTSKAVAKSNKTTPTMKHYIVPFRYHTVNEQKLVLTVRPRLKPN